ncbi:retrovirus-related Pol polyprotein from transposon 17.6 [Trichonephila clavipes]|nr:retrovirus-related Pol polyprotein from transposon 17.6 [Trichonephila clavipes]
MLAIMPFGAVLLQGEGSDEHPIEYASRLLTPAERNYSTTEREALAVVWALKKFRGYIEGTEITVASDHQPLKWLLNLKSPTGRLARLALEIQSFNLKVQYIPGKAKCRCKHVPSPSTATTAVSNRTIHPSTRATTTTANYVSSPGRRRIHRGDCNPVV